MARLNARELEDFKNRIGRFTSKKVYAFFPILFFFRATFPFFLSSAFYFLSFWFYVIPLLSHCIREINIFLSDIKWNERR